MKRWRLPLRSAIFFLLLATAIYGLQGVFRVEILTGEQNDGFYREKAGSLDAVYIGGSDVYRFWQPLFGWNDHGIAVWNLSASEMNVHAVKHMIIEARKRQPDALYIISLTTFKRESADIDMPNIHRIADYMPLSRNKIDFIESATAAAGITGLDKLEYYLPIIRFHSRWDTLTSADFNAFEDELKGSSDSLLLFHVEDISPLFTIEDGREDVPEDVLRVFEDLLDYCDANGLKTLFVKSPQAVAPDAQRRMNALEDILAARGYPCLDLLEGIDSTGIDLTTDFYNDAHTNVHGSLKFSKALGDYLVENYSLVDKRGLPGWESWDLSCQEYTADLKRNTLPLEWAHAPRYHSDIPVLGKAKVDGSSVELSWTAVEGADGYEIQRRGNSKKDEDARLWIALERVEGGAATTYRDEKLPYSRKYTYTVVPYRMIDGETVYGCFDPNGIDVRTGKKSEGKKK